MTRPAPRIVMITAGAGGMYCGSCLQDNALAAALTKAGSDIQLVPTYTPLQTDQPDQSSGPVFFGGINVYLEQKLPFWGKLPDFLIRWLDHPAVIRFAAGRGLQTDAALLGEMTVSMLRGPGGRQRAEVERLVRWLKQHAQPDLVHFSNVLIAAAAVPIKRQLGSAVLVTLQGDDFFLQGLPAAYQQQALELIQRIDHAVDGYVVHTEFYADQMAEYLGLDRAKFHQVPLAIAADDLPQKSPGRAGPPTVGYLARLAPEKGLHLLGQAFTQLRRHEDTADARLLIGGWLGADQRDYADRVFAQLTRDCGADSFGYRGTLTRAAKREFLADIDVLSVPTTFAEPKGLYVLEALATATPVVQPAHGSFPELIEATGGGLLCQPDNADSLATELRRLLTDAQLRQRLGAAGRECVLQRHTTEVAAQAVRELYRTIPQTG